MRRICMLVGSLLLATVAPAPGSAAPAGPALVPPAAPLHLTPPPAPIAIADGDRVVVGSETIRGELHLDGNLIVAPGGHLVIEDARVFFDVRATRFGLTVAPGGRLDVRRSTISNDPQPGENDDQRLFRHWTFAVQGPTTIADSDISYAREVQVTFGPFTMERTAVHDTWHSGVSVNRAVLPVVIRDNTISRNRFIDNAFGGAIYLSGTAGAVVERNLVQDAAGTGVICSQASTVGSYAFPDDPRIAGNVIVPAPYNESFYTPLYIDGGRPVIEDNAAVVRSNAIHVVYDSGALVRRNTFVGAMRPDGTTPQFGMIATYAPVTGRAYHLEPAFTGNLATGMNVAFQNQRLGHPVLRENDLLGRTHGIRSINLSGDSDASPTAQLGAGNNWFGDPSGPKDEDAEDGSSPAVNGGAGSAIFGNVGYAEWATVPHRGPLVEIEPAAATASPGATVVVPVTVRNRLGATYFAHLGAFNAPAGWSVSVPAGVAVGAGETAVVDVRVSVPPSAQPGIDRAEIVITTRGATSAFASAGAVSVTV